MKRSLIFLPIVVLVVLLAAYVAYWAYVVSAITDAVMAMKERPSGGAPRVDFTELNVGGFPFRIEIAATAVRIESADVQFSVARLDAYLQPYDLGHIVLRVGGEVSLNVVRRDERGAPAPLRIEGTPKSFLASYIVDEDGPARLDVAVNEFAGSLTDGANAPVSLTANLAEIHLRRAPDGANATDLVAKLENATVGPGIEMLLGQTISRAFLETRLQNLALPALQSADYVRAWAQSGGRADVTASQLLWGGVDIEAKGAFALDAMRHLEGRMDTGIIGYDALLDKLFAAGRINMNERSLLSDTLGIVAAMGGGRASIPFNFARGKIFLGPVAIGELRPLF